MLSAAGVKRVSHPSPSSTPRACSDAPPPVVVYDGDCPVCRLALLAVVKPQWQEGTIWVDARVDSDTVRRLWRDGVDLNRGFVLTTADGSFFGWQALHQLSVRAALPSRWGPRLVMRACRRRWVARVMYPVFVAMRGVLLRVLGIPPLRPRASTDA